MLKNYFVISLRNLLKNPGFTFLNITGLALGMTFALLIILYVQDELSYDQYHTKADRTYRVVEIIEPVEESSSLPFPARGALKNDYPHLIEETVGFFNFQSTSLLVRYEEEGGEIVSFNESNIFLADSSVFKVFDNEFILGDAGEALNAPGTAVFTESTAKRYFGDDNPIGKVLTFDGNTKIQVTGIVKDVPRNSHFTYDILISMTTMQQIFGNFQENNWFWNPVWSYVVLKEGVTPTELEAQFPAFVEKNFHPAIREKTSLYLQPLTDIHLHSNIDYEIKANSDISLVYIFSAIGLMLLLIAGINFINLSTARAMSRAREVGVRKVMGAFKKNLIFQFLTESMLYAFFAAVIAVPLALLILPYLNSIAGKEITLFSEGASFVPLIMFALIVFLGIGAGSYPAFVLSAFQPVKVLKGEVTKGSQGGTMRQVLVVGQFTISVFLIVATIFVVEQLNLLQGARLGFDKEQVIVLQVNRSPLSGNYETFRGQLVQHSSVVDVTAADNVIGTGLNTSSFKVGASTDDIMINASFVRMHYAETMGIQVIAGRSFKEEFPADDSASVMVNKAFVEAFDLGSPEEALGLKVVDQLLGERRIVGVTENFHFAPLRQPISPVVMSIPGPNPGGKAFFTNYYFIRTSPGELEQALAHTEEVFTRLAPGRPFEYTFLDERLNRQYRSEISLSSVAGILAGVAVVIACLGLFGLTAFTTQQRTKEIGIRKTLGASAGTIIYLMSRQFLTLILLANLIAWPMAYFVVDRWLQEFSNRVGIGAGPFLIAALATLVLAFITMSYQTFRAALLNPVTAIKSSE